MRNLGKFFPENEYHLYTTKINKTPETLEFIENSCFYNHLPKTFFKSYWRSYSIVSQLKKDNIQLYHGLSHEIPVNIDKSSIKSIVTIHDLIFKVYPETYSAIDRKIYDLKFRYSCQHADKIIAISENTKQDIIKYYNTDPDKIEVIYQSCNPLYYQQKNQEENDIILQQYNIPKEYLLYVGSIEPRKNLKTIIEAFQFLPEDLKVPLVIIGRGGAYKLEVEKLIRKTGVGSFVLWIENLKNNEHLQSIYQSSLALIYPSFYEGFGLPVVEALLCKTPVIASGTSALQEAGGLGSLYIDPNSPEQLSNGIIKVLTDSAYRQKMKEDGYFYAHKKFSSESVTKKIIDCYKNTL